jgi:hypothetical protein
MTPCSCGAQHRERRQVAAHLLESRALVVGDRGYLRVSVESADVGVVTMLSDLFGGDVLPRQVTERTWRWRVSGLDAARVLWATLPYLRTDEARDVWSSGFLLASLRGRQRVKVPPWTHASRIHATAVLRVAHYRLQHARQHGDTAVLAPGSPDLVLVSAPGPRAGYNDVLSRPDGAGKETG